MLKTVLDHQKATVISEELPISFSGVSLLRRSGVCLCGISNGIQIQSFTNQFHLMLHSIIIQFQMQTLPGILILALGI